MNVLVTTGYITSDRINHPGLTRVALLISRASTALQLHSLNSGKRPQTYVKSSGTHSVIIQTDRQTDRIIIIIIQLPALGIHQQPTQELNQHLCEPSPTTARLEKGRGEITTQPDRRGRGWWEGDATRSSEKNQVVDQQGADAALLRVVDQQGAGAVSLSMEERPRHRRRQHVGYTFKLFLPVFLAYSIEGGTSAGVALLQLP